MYGTFLMFPPTQLYIASETLKTVDVHVYESVPPQYKVHTSSQGNGKGFKLTGTQRCLVYNLSYAWMLGEGSTV